MLAKLIISPARLQTTLFDDKSLLADVAQNMVDVLSCIFFDKALDGFDYL